VRWFRAEAAATAEAGRNLLRWRRVRLRMRAEVVRREAGNRWEARDASPWGENRRDVNREARRIGVLTDLRVAMVPKAEVMDLTAGVTDRWDVDTVGHLVLR
jgi:hypothetical protein